MSTETKTELNEHDLVAIPADVGSTPAHIGSAPIVSEEIATAPAGHEVAGPKEVVATIETGEVTKEVATANDGEIAVEGANPNSGETEPRVFIMISDGGEVPAFAGESIEADGEIAVEGANPNSGETVVEGEAATDGEPTEDGETATDHPRKKKKKKNLVKRATFEALSENQWLEGTVKSFEETKKGKMVRVNIGPDLDGLLPEKRVLFKPDTREIMDLAEGDVIKVRVANLDKQSLHVQLSMLEPPKRREPRFTNESPAGDTAKASATAQWDELETAFKAKRNIHVQCETFQPNKATGKSSGVNTYWQGIRCFLPMLQLPPAANADVLVEQRTWEWVRITHFNRDKQDVVVTMRLDVDPEEIEAEAAERARLRAERIQKRAEQEAQRQERTKQKAEFEARQAERKRRREEKKATFDTLVQDTWVKGTVTGEPKKFDDYTLLFINLGPELDGALPMTQVRRKPGTQDPIDMPPQATGEFRIVRKIEGTDEKGEPTFKVSLSMLPPPDPNRPKRHERNDRSEGQGRTEKRGDRKDQRDSAPRGNRRDRSSGPSARETEKVKYSTESAQHAAAMATAGNKEKEPAKAPAVKKVSAPAQNWQKFEVEGQTFEINMANGAVRNCAWTLMKVAQVESDKIKAALKAGVATPADSAAPATVEAGEHVVEVTIDGTTIAVETSEPEHVVEAPLGDGTTIAVETSEKPETVDEAEAAAALGHPTPEHSE